MSAGSDTPGQLAYQEYLKTQHWRAFRNKRKREYLFAACMICGNKERELHHITYERLHRERRLDVAPLCRECHQKIHDCGFWKPGLSNFAKQIAAAFGWAQKRIDCALKPWLERQEKERADAERAKDRKANPNRRKKRKGNTKSERRMNWQQAAEAKWKPEPKKKRGYSPPPKTLSFIFDGRMPDMEAVRRRDSQGSCAVNIASHTETTVR